MEELEKSNVSLKEIQKSDRDEFYRIAKDSRVKKFVGFLYPEDKTDAESILDFIIDPDYICFKIVESESGNMVGVIFGDKLSEEKIDVCFLVGKDYRKRGYCTTAINLFATYLKENTAFKEMQFYVRSRNKNSRNVMKRLRIMPKITQKKEIIYSAML